MNLRSGVQNTFRMEVRTDMEAKRDYISFMNPKFRIAVGEYDCSLDAPLPNFNGCAFCEHHHCLLFIEKSKTAIFVCRKEMDADTGLRGECTEFSREPRIKEEK